MPTQDYEDKRIGVRFSDPDQYDEIHQAAGRRGMSDAGFLRMAGLRIAAQDKEPETE